MKSNKHLNDKTPKWFRDWHETYYAPLKAAVAWNTRLVFIVLAVILAAAITGDADIVGRLVRAFGG